MPKQISAVRAPHAVFLIHIIALYLHLKFIQQYLSLKNYFTCHAVLRNKIYHPQFSLSGRLHYCLTAQAIIYKHKRLIFKRALAEFRQ